MSYRYFYVLRDRTEYENVLATFDTIEQAAEYLGITPRELYYKQADIMVNMRSTYPPDVYAVWRDKILYVYDVKVLKNL